MPRFGEFELDLQARELNRDGRRIRLQEQPFQVLVMLLGRAGKVVTREELRQKLWPSSVYVDFDHGLNNAIGRLREALGDVAATPRFIETLPRLGYRFIAPIMDSRAPAGMHGHADSIACPPEPAAAATGLSAKKPLWQRRGVIAAAAVAVVAIAAVLLFGPLRTPSPAGETPPATAGVKAPSIAVLPFVDMSEDEDHGYLADGIAEEILNRLSQSKDLRVISRTSSFAFRGKPLDIREIAEKLNVDHVLEGSVRRSGDRIRITAQLIAASDNAHVWSETFEREFGSTFRVQDEIAASVATALQVTLRGSDACCPASASPEALELFLRGQFFYNRRAPGDIERSVKYYRDALAIDPAFARAWAALAGAYNLLSFEDGADQERLLPLQGEAAHKAVELAPRMAVAHARLGQYYDRAADPIRGDEHFQRAQALDPDDELVMGFFSEELVWRGDYAAAVEIWRRLVERDPLSPTSRLNYGSFLTMAGRYPEAIAEHRKAFELNPGLNWNAHFGLARALILQREYEAAHDEILKVPEGEPRDLGLALLHAAPGHVAEADAALQRMVARPFAANDVSLAEAYAHRGMTDEAFAALHAARNAIYVGPDRQVRAHPRLFQLKIEMLKSPFLVSLQSDRRWQEFMTAN